MERTKFPSTQKITYQTEDEPIILSKAILDIFLKDEKPSDLIALYCFYYYTAKWQKTNQPKCTSSYVSKALNWGEDKIRLVKGKLRKLKLIENISTKHNGKVTGHYIKINFIWKSHPLENQGYENITPRNYHPLENQGGNALSTNNKNALSTNNSVYNRAREENKSKKEQNIIPPSFSMVKEYCSKRKNDIDPETFINFYKSKGWMIGKNKMVDWHSAIHTWEKSRKQNNSPKVKNTWGSRIENSKVSYRESDEIIN